MSGARQLPLQFPEPWLSFDDMTITTSNRGAIAAARRIQHWPYHVFCLIGPAQSGLTTIARAWADEHKGTYLRPQDLTKPDTLKALPESTRFLAIDDADQLGKEVDLLTLISAMNRQNGRLLLTAKTPPTHWPSSSPDLASRLKSAPLAELAPPDEEMMRARLNRAAKRAFLVLPQKLEDYLVTRLGLSYVAIEQMVTELSSRMDGRELTVPLAREIIDEFDGQGGLFVEED